MELEDGGLYWVEGKYYGSIQVAKYDAGWSDGGCFYLIGSDEQFPIDSFNVIGKLEVPVLDK